MIAYLNERGGLVLLAERFEADGNDMKLGQIVLELVAETGGRIFLSEQEALAHDEQADDADAQPAGETPTDSPDLAPFTDTPLD